MAEVYARIFVFCLQNNQQVILELSSHIVLKLQGKNATSFIYKNNTLVIN